MRKSIIIKKLHHADIHRGGLCLVQRCLLRTFCIILAINTFGCSNSDNSGDNFRALYYANATNRNLLLDVKYVDSDGDTLLITDIAQNSQFPSWSKEIDTVAGDTLFISVCFSQSNPDSLWSIWPLSLAAGIDVNRVDGGAHFVTRSIDWPDTIFVTKQFVVE